MDKGGILYIFIIIIAICFIYYNSIPSLYTKLEESSGGFLNRSLVRFEYEKSPLHTIVYWGTGTGKTYFIRQYLKLYIDQDLNQDQNQNQQQAKNIIIVCKDDRDSIDPETGEFYIGFNKGDINMITSKNKSKVLDDMGDKLNKDIAFYFTEGRHYNIQMNVMCHKPAQIINTARMNCDTIYLTTYNGADLFKNFNEIYKCGHNVNKIISELSSNYYNCTDAISDELRYGIIKYNRREKTFITIDKNGTMIYESGVGFIDLKALSLKDELEREDINKLIAYMEPLMINATDINVINHNNYIFYFNKLLKLNNIKIQNHVLTQEMVTGKGIKNLSTIGGNISSGLFIISYIYPDMISRNAGYIAMGASTMLNKVSALVNVGYGEELYNDLRSSSTKLFCKFTYPRNTIQREYINEEDGILNRKGGKYLSNLYENNEEFRDEIINFIRDKKELDLEVILDRRYKTNTFNTTGKKYLTECVASKDNTKDVIEILAKYYESN